MDLLRRAARPAALAIVAASAGLFAAACEKSPPSPQQQALVARRDAKLAEDWVKAAAWHVDYDEARAEAARSGKLIFAYFTRSYAP